MHIKMSYHEYINMIITIVQEFLQFVDMIDKRLESWVIKKIKSKYFRDIYHYDERFYDKDFVSNLFGKF